MQSNAAPKNIIEQVLPQLSVAAKQAQPRRSAEDVLSNADQGLVVTELAAFDYWAKSSKAFLGAPQSDPNGCFSEEFVKRGKYVNLDALTDISWSAINKLGGDGGLDKDAARHADDYFLIPHILSEADPLRSLFMLRQRLSHCSNSLLVMSPVARALHDAFEYSKDSPSTIISLAFHKRRKEQFAAAGDGRDVVDDTPFASPIWCIDIDKVPVSSIENDATWPELVDRAGSMGEFVDQLCDALGLDLLIGCKKVIALSQSSHTRLDLFSAHITFQIDRRLTKAEGKALAAYCNQLSENTGHQGYLDTGIYSPEHALYSATPRAFLKTHRPGEQPYRVEVPLLGERVFFDEGDTLSISDEAIEVGKLALAQGATPGSVKRRGTRQAKGTAADFDGPIPDHYLGWVEHQKPHGTEPILFSALLGMLKTVPDSERDEALTELIAAFKKQIEFTAETPEAAKRRIAKHLNDTNIKAKLRSAQKYLKPPPVTRGGPQK